MAEWGWVQEPLAWDKTAVWAQAVVEAVSFLPRRKVQRWGPGPRQGGPASEAWQQVGRAGSFPIFPWRARPACLWAKALTRSGSPGAGVSWAWWAAASLGPGDQSWVSSARHLRAWSLWASGSIWFLIPPSKLDVASVARMRGFTTVGGSWRITPPTAPVSPFCSWPRDATSQMV